MSDEEQPPAEEKNVEETPVEESSSDVESTVLKEQNNKLKEKFRLTNDEKILKDIKPSIFAFVPMYIIALLILFAHWMFEINWDDGESTLATIMQGMITFGKVGNFGFVLVMLTLTWFNRMLNGSTSGKWSTLYLLLVTFTPMILSIDNIMESLGIIEEGFIPLDDFHYLAFGIFWSALFVALTIFYQRSFHYAITNHRVVFTQHLFIPGDGRRILFDNINEIRTQRTFMGAMLGYNTIICDTGSQLGIGEDSMSVSVGSAGSSGSSEGGSVEAQVTRSFFKRLFAFVTYQRTRKVDLPDPRFSFFCITNWKTVENLLNEMHQKHSQSGILNDLKDQIAESQ
ncbi:MAG: PH domain-containing protein [Candidatus Poseidoniales archaeon]|nr:MAG: PH domain-containing protein [Candidatus Poseidoniales archaeon]